MAPGGTGSLLRRLLGAHGAALMGKCGVRTLSAAAPRQDATAGMSRAGAELGEAAIARSAGASAGRCDSTNRAFGTTKVLAVCGLGAAVLWSGAGPAVADDVTPPPTTTTTDAPPPDPYKPPVRTVKPKPATPRRTYTPPARTYTPPATIAPRPAVQASRPRRQAKAVRHPRKQPVRHPAKAPPVSTTWLAPLPRAVAAAGIPLSAADERDDPYLWLVGIAFAVLAVAGLSLHMLSVRYFAPRFE
jgi:surface antigen